MDTLQTECRCLPSNSLTVCVDMEGGHFRPANPEVRAKGRAVELGFVLHALRQAIGQL